ncbi:hypothetical protein niasHT_017020 [Heterodera trifolii]|uniref:Uncharacterized protein n=1 Tax=Heterodera trifolii TaxID=157864 RepID=A0ABD2KY31_9BILA
MKDIATEESIAQRRLNLKANFMRQLQIRRGVLPSEIPPIGLSTNAVPTMGRKFRKPLESRFAPAKPRFGLGMTAADFEDKTDNCSSLAKGPSLTETNAPKERNVRPKAFNCYINPSQSVFTWPGSNDTDSDGQSPSPTSSASVTSFGSSLTTATDPLVAQHVDQNGTIFFPTSSAPSDHGQSYYDETPASSVLTFDLSSHTSSDRTLTNNSPLSMNNETLRPVFALFHEVQFLHSLGRRLSLSCNSRQDEGSFIFKHQMLNKMIVLTRSEALGEEEGIRISQHKDGRIFRESYIPSNMENWMVKSLLRGLCEDFFLD